MTRALNPDTIFWPEFVTRPAMRTSLPFPRSKRTSESLNVRYVRCVNKALRFRYGRDRHAKEYQHYAGSRQHSPASNGPYPAGGGHKR